MPQPSIYYASGRIGVLRRTMLKKAQLERLQSAKNYTDATRALTEIGFTSADGTDFQTAADQHVLKACRLVHAVTPEPLLTDCFLLRYDAHNLKILLKSRQMAQKPEFLSACGTIDAEKLRHCVADHTYGPLPQEFKTAMETLEKKIAVRFDPMLVDTVLDQATFRQIFTNLKGCKNAGTVKRYFQAKADLQNILILLRLKAMKKNAADFAGMALPGGTIPIRTLTDAFMESDRLIKLTKRFGPALQLAVTDAATDAKKLPFLEKVSEDYLFGLIKSRQYDTESMETIVSYLLQKRREATDVRLVMAGKLNGFAPEAVGERMRELDG